MMLFTAIFLTVLAGDPAFATDLTQLVLLTIRGPVSGSPARRRFRFIPYIAEIIPPRCAARWQSWAWLITLDGIRSPASSKGLVSRSATRRA